MLYCNCETSQLTKLQQKENLFGMSEADNQHGNLLSEAQAPSSHKASYRRGKSQDKSQASLTDNHRRDKAEIEPKGKAILGKQEAKTQPLSRLRGENMSQGGEVSQVLSPKQGVQGEGKQGSQGDEAVSELQITESKGLGEKRQSTMEGRDNASNQQEIEQKRVEGSSPADIDKGQPHLSDVREAGEYSSRDNHLDTRKASLYRRQPSNIMPQVPHKTPQAKQSPETVICPHCNKPKVPEGKSLDDMGFRFVERHERVLPSQSFWRIIYQQRFPEVEQIKSEDILVFKKCLN